MEPSHDVSLILCLPSILVLLAPLVLSVFSPVFSPPRVASNNMVSYLIYPPLKRTNGLLYGLFCLNSPPK